MEEQEPSLLDYLKEKLSLRRLFSTTTKNTDPAVDAENRLLEPEINNKPTRSISLGKLPWLIILSLGLALAAQGQLEPPEPNAIAGVVLYVLSAGMLVIALFKGEIQIDPLRAQEPQSMGMTIRRLPLFFFIPLILASFLSFAGNLFTSLNVTLWIATLATGVWAFWERENRADQKSFRERMTTFFRGGEVQLKVDYWKLLVVAVFLIAAWFHFYQLNEIPINMTSDHTEKLLDVQGVLEGNTQIFFANNGGREPIHFYFTAFLVKFMGAGLNFFTLKLTMTLAFLVSLIYVYRLGNEMGGRWTGLFFMALFGFSAWGNMITRVGLRLVLTPVFVAPVLFYFFRGLRTSRRNDFVLAGILLGLGLLGYSAFRLMPVVVVAGVFTYLVYQKFNKTSRSSVWALLLMALFAMVIFLPILRFAVDYPEAFGFRTLTRITGAEQPLPGQVFKVFLGNFWNAALMPFWKDGSTWVISVTDRPALDIIGAALYFLGLVLSFYRWLKYRSWQDLFLLLSIPLLMMPSILSLAFPDENPSLSRAGGAAIPIFLLGAIALKTLLSSLWKRSPGLFGKICVVALGLILLEVSAAQNYEIALVQYPRQYKEATWNSTQMAEVVDDFIELNKEPDNVWVVGVAHWVDTRLVALSAGYIGRDYAVWPQDLELTLPNVGAKLFIVKFDDLTGMERLRALYPQGYAVYHLNEVDGRDFYAYIVPPK